MQFSVFSSCPLPRFRYFDILFECAFHKYYLLNVKCKEGTVIQSLYLLLYTVYVFLFPGKNISAAYRLIFDSYTLPESSQRAEDEYF